MLNAAEHFVQQEIKEHDGLMNDVKTAMQSISEYASTHYSYTLKSGEVKEFTSKNKRLQEWSPDKGTIYEVVLGIFTTVLLEKRMTYQSLIGMQANKIKVVHPLDRAKIVAECIALVDKNTELIDIQRNGAFEYTTITTKFSLSHLPPEPDRHPVYLDPLPIREDNRDEGGVSLILGVYQNHHDGDICLDHINRMNQMPLSLNKEFLRKYSEEPKKPWRTKEQEDQWHEYLQQCYAQYIQIARHGNVFYLNHCPDKRGRTYAEGYHLSTQGSSFKKAVIQFAQPELVEGYDG